MYIIYRKVQTHRQTNSWTRYCCRQILALYDSNVICPVLPAVTCHCPSLSMCTIASSLTRTSHLRWSRGNRLPAHLFGQWVHNYWCFVVLGWRCPFQKFTWWVTSDAEMEIPCVQELRTFRFSPRLKPGGGHTIALCSLPAARNSVCFILMFYPHGSVDLYIFFKSSSNIR